MQRRTTTDVRVGDLGIGSMHPVRIQSMTTTLTMDTEATIAQSIRMIEAGCEIVRITAPSLREAKNLEFIRKGLNERGYNVPICADIHYTPNAAEVAARLVEKVRINPGNYVDKKNFNVIEYDDATYAAEIVRIRERFLPLLALCKEYGTAMRIGTNHGSLSDRIMSRFGDNPAGMVESALEFLRIAEDEGYYDIVLSMKSSNPVVMVEAYRLLVQRLDEEGLRPYPLHLGVTEAGEGEDGRVKSAVGIGTLLQEGLGDTIRVSLTEEPEAELPVARILAVRPLSADTTAELSPFIPGAQRRAAQTTNASAARVANIGASFVPRVIADFSTRSEVTVDDLAEVGHVYDAAMDKWQMAEQGCDYIYSGSNPIGFMMPNGVRELMDVAAWLDQDEHLYKVPVYASPSEYLDACNAATIDLPGIAPGVVRHNVMNVVRMNISDVQSIAADPSLIDLFKNDTTIVILAESSDPQPLIPFRNFFNALPALGVQAPIILRRFASEADLDSLRLNASTDIGGMLIDGYGNGVMLSPTMSTTNTIATTNPGASTTSHESSAESLRTLNTLAFNILQATRTRITKTEYISCPSCGRTLFDLQETTAAIREQTDHLKGLKIGVMGCIVNGPGEMADADYGYVGSGPERITLYRGKEIVRRNIPTADALQELVAIIKEDDRWIDR